MLELSEIVNEIDAQTKLFYIYILHKPDGTPFYVGKGKYRIKDQRICYHECEAKNGEKWLRKCKRNLLKINTIKTIKKIWREGGKVLYSVDSWYDIESDVYVREKELIKSIGRIIDGTGPLTNLTEGGEKEMTTISQESREQISNSLKKYYAENPEALKKMSEEGKKQFSTPESRERQRLNAIKGDNIQHLRKWEANLSQEDLEKKWAEHSDRMKVWHINNREKTKEIAAKRNEGFRTEKHRNHMSEATARYIRENPEADKARRDKAARTKLIKTNLRTECFNLIRDYLVKYKGFNNNQTFDVTKNQIYSWHIKGIISEEIYDMILASRKIEEVRIMLETCKKLAKTGILERQ